MAFLESLLQPIDWLPLADALVKTTLLLAIAAGLARLLRRSSAAARHLVWTSALVATLVLPVLTIALPSWAVPIYRLSDRTDVQHATARPRDEPLPASNWVPQISTATAFSLSPIDTPAAEANTAGRDRFGLSRTSLLVAGWAAGALLILGWLTIGLVSVNRMARRTDPADGASWLPLARELAADLGVSRVEFRRGRPASMPMTWGLKRPVVSLPVNADTWPEERLRIVLLHELAHVKRADCLTHLLSQAACALYWMHPLAWIAAARARAERERACDDLVLAHGTQGPDYASELLEIARVMRGTRLSTAAASASLAMAHRSQLEGRLMAILDPTIPRSGVSRMRSAAAVLVAICVLAPLASLDPWAPAEAAAAVPDDVEQARPRPRPAPRPAPVAVGSVDVAPVVEKSVPVAVKDSGNVAVADVAAAVEGAMRSLPEIVHVAVDAALSGAEAAQEAKTAVNPKVVAALLEALKDVDVEVRESAMHALVRLRDPSVFEPLVHALKDPSADMREQAAFGLGQLRDPRATESLRAALKDQSAGVREQVVFALGQLRDKPSVDALAEALRDASASVREQAAFALGQIRDERATEPLVSVMKDANDSVREQAAFALGQLRARGAVDALVAALKDANASVREQAAFALGQIGDPRAIDALTAALKDASAQVRQQVAFALGQLAR